MATKLQKKNGWDTVKVEDVDEGYAEAFNLLLKIRAGRTESKTIQEAFEEVTEVLLVHYLGPKEAARALWSSTGLRKDFE